jgi:ribosome biogenesis protein ERB1
MASKKIATADYSFEFEYNDPMPISSHPPSKRNFMPSKWEQMKVNKILDGLLTGRIKWNKEDNENEEEKNKEEEIYDAWASGAIEERGVINIAPMKNKLPGHN